ncbi:MAG: CHASE4 domain-containing protein [Cyanobacteria bacterium P01_D01_bin.44]
MNLRQKTLLIVGTALVGLPLMSFGIASTVLIRGFSKLENQVATRNIQRVLDTLDNDLATLARTATDWGSWDATYNYVRDRNPDYLTENFPEDGNTLLYLRLNLVVLLDNSGEVVFAQQFDLDEDSLVPTPDSLLDQIRPYFVQLSHTETDSQITGLLPLKDHPLVVASRPIITSNFEGPIQGTIIMARFLNGSEVERFEALTSLPKITLESLDSAQVPPDLQSEISNLDKQHQTGENAENQPVQTPDPATVIEPLSPTEIASYALLKDLTDQPLRVLRVLQPREVYAQGRDSLRFLVLATAITAIVLSSITVLLLEREVLSRLKRLAQKVGQIGADHDLSVRVSLSGKDELTDFASTINHTLDQLEQSQQTLQQKSKALAASNTELEQFAYVASHDLQAPLRKIESFGEILHKDYAQSLDVEGQTHLQRMQNAARRMRYLIQDLLELSRINAPTQSFTSVDLTTVVHQVIADLDPQIQQLDAQVTAEDLPILEAEPAQMRQLFQNLISNALKFHRPDVLPIITVTGKTPIKENPQKGSDVLLKSQMCRISVVDNGIGFEERFCDRIFKIFQRLHPRDQYEGTGIGLAICSKIVQQHNGTLMVTSRLGEGSTFTVVLPLSQPSPCHDPV